MASVFLGINDRVFTYEYVAGRSEVFGTGFRNPVDFALAPGDIVYALNRAPEARAMGIHVTVFSLNEEGEDYITEFGSYGESPGQFLWPSSVAIDEDTNVYVSDEYLHRITVFDKDGNYLSHWGIHGSGDGELYGPAGLEIRDNILFLADSRNHRVQKFTLDGRYIGQFGGLGDGPGQLNRPWGIGTDKERNVFVADWRNDRVQSFTNDGRWLASFGRPGTGGDAFNARIHGGIHVVDTPVGLFNRPSGVAVDNDGDIYVADWLNSRVQVLTPEGRFITQFTGDAGLSKWGVAKIASNPDMIRQRNGVRDFTPERVLWTPVSVKVDDTGRIIIADTSGHRFQVYQKRTEPVLI